MGLLLSAEVATFFYAWKTSDIPEDFRVTQAVTLAMLLQLQARICLAFPAFVQ